MPVLKERVPRLPPITVLTGSRSEVELVSAPVLWPTLAPWLVLALILTITTLWARALGVSFPGIEVSILAVGFFCLIWGLYVRLGRSAQVADMARYLALWFAFMAITTPLSYLAATFNLPLRDVEFARADELLGFDWMMWHEFVRATPVVETVLWYAYFSLLVQPFVAVLIFGHLRRRDRNEELWWNALLTLIVCVVVWALLPALGPWVHYGIPDRADFYAPHVLGLRDGSMTEFVSLAGIVVFPSYHTVGAVVLTWVFREMGRLFYFVAALNALMLLSIPIIGGHYLVDVIAGILVAALSIVVLGDGARRVHFVRDLSRKREQTAC
jgi:membrane-associated phospholipid phosphatase